MGILDIVVILLIISWLGGTILNIAGGLIHTLLVIALVVFIYRMVTGKKA